ncbi:CYTH domain-containing protein [Patescibacteria group bacterium]|nr:CYTH domain-containing protein [Patescibacteria group bacterium]
MIEYKAKYSHEKAKEILDEIGAVFVQKEQHDDFYLKIDNGRIFKLQKNGDDIYLVLLNREDGGFAVDMHEYLPKETSDVLLPLFKGNQYVLRKTRELYSWKGSKIELDSVEKYGEFIEFYPVDEEAKPELFEKFGIEETDLITKSYFSL